MSRRLVIPRTSLMRQKLRATTSRGLRRPASRGIRPPQRSAGTTAAAECSARHRPIWLRRSLARPRHRRAGSQPRPAWRGGHVRGVAAGQQDRLRAALPSRRARILALRPPRKEPSVGGRHRGRPLLRAGRQPKATPARPHAVRRHSRAADPRDLQRAGAGEKGDEAREGRTSRCPRRSGGMPSAPAVSAAEDRGMRPLFRKAGRAIGGRGDSAGRCRCSRAGRRRAAALHAPSSLSARLPPAARRSAGTGVILSILAARRRRAPRRACGDRGKIPSASGRPRRAKPGNSRPVPQPTRPPPRAPDAPPPAAEWPREARRFPSSARSRAD